MKYGNRSAWKKILRSPIVFCIFFIVLVFLVKATWGMYDKSSLSNERLDQVKASLAELENRKNVLSEKVAYLSTEQGVESEIRTKFRAAQEGESVAVIVGDTPVVNILGGEVATSTVRLSWWQKVLRVFGI